MRYFLKTKSLFSYHPKPIVSKSYLCFIFYILLFTYFCNLIFTQLTSRMMTKKFHITENYLYTFLCLYLLSIMICICLYICRSMVKFSFQIMLLYSTCLHNPQIFYMYVHNFKIPVDTHCICICISLEFSRK